ncbi:hypothetical protein XENTR_v10003504 [Xenopus tropicalis]|nr:hypothetical protein XENTR_v10003504 [Xenopus tropicalis]
MVLPISCSVSSSSLLIKANSLIISDLLPPLHSPRSAAKSSIRSFKSPSFLSNTDILCIKSVIPSGCGLSPPSPSG